MWISGRRLDPGDGTAPSGVLSWARPTLGAIPAGGLTDLLLPSGVAMVKGRTSAITYLGDTYMAGGFTQNLRLTTRLRAWIQGISAPSNPIVSGTGTGNNIGATVATGAGLEGSVVAYVSWWDDETQETSPLSQASPALTLTLANGLIDFNNLPTSKPEDDFKIPGTTTASASTTITGVGTAFLDDVRVGDKISLSSAPATFSIVKAVASDTSLSVATVLGDGSTQTITVRRQMRPTHLRIWYALDGNLPRVAEQRQVGVTDVTPQVLSIADLGEAFTEDFTRFPACPFNSEYHDRQYMAGDPEHPDRIYTSLIGFPERMSAVELKTRSGAAVTGLYRVRDSLYVGLAQGHEVIEGYTEDDIRISPVAPALGQQPGLGLVCHFGVGLTPDGNAIVPTQFGIYLNDGSAFYPLNKQHRSAWTKDFKARPEAYEQTFCYVDAERHVYAIWLGQHPLIPKTRTTTTTDVSGTTTANLDLDIFGSGGAFTTELEVGDQISLSSDVTNFATVTEITDDENLVVDLPLGNGTSQTIRHRDVELVSLNAYLVLDYKKVLPVEGGGMGPPRLSWDTQAREDEYAAIFALPGAKSGSVVTGSCDGNMYRRNVATNTDDSGDIGMKRVLIVEGADAGGDEGGDFMHGKIFNGIELYTQCEKSLFTLALYPGDEFAYPNADDISGSEVARGPIRSFNRLGSSLLRASITINEVGLQATYEPKTIWTVPLRGCSGRRMTVVLLAYRASDFSYLGRTLYWLEGPAPRRITRYG